MNRKQIISICLLLLLSSSLFCEEFIFKYNKGDKYKIITNGYQKIFLNGDEIGSAEFNNKIAVEIIDTKGTSGLWSATIQVLEKTSDNPVFRIKDEAKVVLWRDARGNYENNPQYLYPLLRNVPFFPEKNYNPGDTWKAEGREFHDFREFKIQLPIEVPIMVNYTYEKNTTIDNTKLSIIKLNYEVEKDLPELRYLPGWHPLLIYGKANITYFWNIEKGRAHSYDDTYDIIYFFNTNEVWEWVGTSKGTLFESPEMKKEKMKEDIEKTIEEEGIKDTTVTTDDEGVTITLENINFSPDSDILLPEEQAKLKKIAAILKKYPKRDLLVTGHTALAGTEEGRLELSDKRAKAVGDYLFILGLQNNMIFKGYGAQFPIADNDTEAGMKKNRRVEIKILEN